MLSAPIRLARLLSVAIALLFVAAPLAARAADVCSLLTKDQIGQVAQDAIRSATPGPNSCIWSGKNSTVYLGIGDGATWATTKSGFQKYGQIQSITGIGDDAFFESPDDPRPTFFALKGGQFINIRVNVRGFSTAQTKAALQNLGAAAVAHL